MAVLSFLKKRKKKQVTIGILGQVNAGKTTLANCFSLDFTGERMGKVSSVPHETRELTERKMNFKSNGHTLQLNLVDTPGIASTIDYRNFLEHGLTRKEAIQRAKEATQGVVKAIQSLDKLDAAVVVVDSSTQPFNQINWTIVGNLESKKIPIIVAANKTDLPESDASLVSDLFEKDVISISALKNEGIDELYNAITAIF